jgi:hypothetical protein
MTNLHGRTQSFPRQFWRRSGKSGLSLAVRIEFGSQPQSNRTEPLSLPDTRLAAQTGSATDCFGRKSEGRLLEYLLVFWLAVCMLLLNQSRSPLPRRRQYLYPCHEYRNLPRALSQRGCRPRRAFLNTGEVQNYKNPST